MLMSLSSTRSSVPFFCPAWPAAAPWRLRCDVGAACSAGLSSAGLSPAALDSSDLASADLASALPSAGLPSPFADDSLDSADSPAAGLVSDCSSVGAVISACSGFSLSLAKFPSLPGTQVPRTAAARSLKPGFAERLLEAVFLSDFSVCPSWWRSLHIAGYETPANA